jgi:hypothetical protein
MDPEIFRELPMSPDCKNFIFFSAVFSFGRKDSITQLYERIAHCGDADLSMQYMAVATIALQPVLLVVTASLFGGLNRG